MVGGIMKTTGRWKLINEILSYNPNELSRSKQDLFGIYLQEQKGVKLWVKRKLQLRTDYVLENIVLLLRSEHE